MTVNKTQLQGKQRLPREIQNLKHQMRALKNPQPIGADSLAVINFAGPNQVYSGSVTLAAAQQVTFTITFAPKDAVLTLWNFVNSVYVDVDATQANLYGGNGNTLTSAQKNILLQVWIDHSDSTESENYRDFKAVLRNNDSGSHIYYFYVTAYLPELAESVTLGEGGL